MKSISDLMGEAEIVLVKDKRGLIRCDTLKHREWARWLGLPVSWKDTPEDWKTIEAIIWKAAEMDRTATIEYPPID